MSAGDEPPDADAGARGQPGTKLRRIRVNELLGSDREAILEHDGQDYRYPYSLDIIK